MKRVRLGVFAAIIAASRAQAQQCDAILDHQLMTQTLIVNKAYADAANKASRCMKQAQSSSSGTSVGVDVPGYGGGDYNQDSNFKSSASDCASSSAAQQEDALHYYAQRALSPDALKAWTQCVGQTQELVCTGVPPTQGGDPEILIFWRPLSPSVARVSSSHIINGTNSDDPQHQNALLAPGSILLSGEQYIAIKRVRQELPTQARLAVAQNSTLRSCSFTIPPVLKRQPPQPAPAPAHDNLTGRLQILKFGGSGQCQQDQSVMYSIAGSYEAMTNEGDARSAANRAASIIQFDHAETAAKDHGCFQ